MTGSIGDFSNSEGQSALALGASAKSGGFEAIGIGRGTTSNGDTAVAIGADSRVELSGKNGIAIGAAASIFARPTGPVPGDVTLFTPEDAIAIGRAANAQETNAIALGKEALAERLDSIAIGRQSLALANNSVALGAGSIATRENAVSFGNDVVDIDEDNDPLTNPVFQRQLINVAAGTQATDAVNKGQMDTEIADVRSDIGGDINNLETKITTNTNTTINEKTKYLAVNSTGIPRSPRQILQIFRSLSGI